MQHFGRVSLADIARDPAIGTPSYVHDLDGIAAEARALEAAFGKRPHLVCYAVKANSAGPILRVLAGQGCGADVVSGPELELALRCGIAPSRIVYSGVAKTDDEIDLGLERGILSIQAESVEELVRIEARSRTKKKNANVSLRINPGIEEIDTHEHIATGHDEAKFGIPMDDLPRAIDAASHMKLVGLTSHVGSQLTRTDEYLQSARILFDLVPKISTLEFVDTGGGFGIDYGEGCAAKPADFVTATLAEMDARKLSLSLHVEPGRALVAKHVILVSSVVQIKEARDRRWMMIDAGMNDLIRPALYRSFHRIVAIDGKEPPMKWRVVGPVCESSDDFGFHDLPRDATKVAILDAGAYGYTMASRYNGRPLPAEVFLSNGSIASVKARKHDWVADRL
jgi:diaminopimelate decarboxylase